MKKIISVLLFLSGLLPLMGENPGPFQVTRILHQNGANFIYLDNSQGIDFTLTVRCDEIEGPAHRPFQYLFIRVYSPSGILLARQWLTPEGGEYPEQLQIRITDAEAGFYTVVSNGGVGPTIQFSVLSDPEFEMGVMNSIDGITPPKNLWKPAWFVIPEGAQKLLLDPRHAGVELFDANGNTVIVGKGEIEFSQDDWGDVWSIDISANTWPGARIRTEGFNVVLGPSAEFVKRFEASRPRFDDGSVAAFEFQVELDRAVRTAFADGIPDVPEVDDFSFLADALAADPDRNQHLITAYAPPLPGLRFYLERQVLDQESPFFGAIHGVSNYFRTDTPMSATTRSRYASVDGYRVEGVGSVVDGTTPPDQIPLLGDGEARGEWSTLSLPGAADTLAFMYNLDLPGNPYYQDPGILARIVLAATRDLMLLNEDELIKRGNSDWMGGHVFIFSRAFTPVYASIGPAVQQHYPEIYRIWTEAIQRYADRFAHWSVFSPANQDTHVLSGILDVYRGSQNEDYLELWSDELDQFIEHMQADAGYFIESYGPCLSYNGLTLRKLGEMYRHTGDDRLLEAGRINLDLLNHTVVEEPGGERVGFSDISHRVHQPFTRSQGLGGRHVWANELAEAGIWYQKQKTEEELESLAEEIRTNAAKFPVSVEEYYNAKHWIGRTVQAASRSYYTFFPDQPLTDGQFPFQQQPFFRVFGDEFVAVKGLDYYTVIYIGSPGLASYHRGLPKAEANGTRTGGGISLLWTPGYGSVLLGQAWNVWTHNGVVVERDAETIHSADYNAVEAIVDEANRSLQVSGQIRDTPLFYRLDYHFSEHGIELQLEVHAEMDFTAEAVYFQWPFYTSGSVDKKIQSAAGELTGTLNSADGFELKVLHGVEFVAGPEFSRRLGDVDYRIETWRTPLPEQWSGGDRIEYRFAFTFSAKGEAAD